MDSINLLSEGLLEQFSSLKSLEETLTQLLTKQSEQLNSYVMKLNFYTSDQEIAEISLMVKCRVMSSDLKFIKNCYLLQMKKMNLYRLKLRSIKSDMLYIHQRVTELKNTALEIQSHKVEQKANKEQLIHYETALVRQTNK